MMRRACISFAARTTITLAALVCLGLVSLESVFAQAPVTVVAPPGAVAGRGAVAELTDALTKLYPQTKFEVRERAGVGKTIYVGALDELPANIAAEVREKVQAPGSYAIVVAGDAAIVAGSGPRATFFAVEALKRRLGFGEYLSFRTAPEPRTGPFSFAGWPLEDAPIAQERVVFDWHNFLSGCSTWNLKEWKQWIDQSARMRFNTVMVHAYGNNPMFGFTFNGAAKPTGYLPNTARGRDWGTEHVADVRNLVGAGNFFRSPEYGQAAGVAAGSADYYNGPIFGADASLAPENEKDAAAQRLMKDVFAYAAERGMGVTFALDVDTESANPQNVIRTLPATARFSVNGFEMVNPDTPEGYAYYHAQMEALMRLYPQISQLAVWFRGGLNSPWRALAPEDFPVAWRAEWAQELKAHPHLRRDPEAPSMFAIGKIVRAFRRALDETGHADVTMTAGSWRFNYLPAADAFMPHNVGLMPLDYDYAFASDPAQETLREVGHHRPVVPIVWAQHDDREYAGRSYTPIAGLGSLVRWSNAAGIGIIHWTTRPLDLFFANVADQVWTATENESLDRTTATMARDLFGQKAAELGHAYLLDWIYDAPAFGEETTDRFVNRNHVFDENNERAGAEKRLALLKKMKPLVACAEAREWIGYYEDWEHYAGGVYHAQAALQRSVAALEAGDKETARREIAAAEPERAVETYASAIGHGETSRGELGLLVSLNLRWLPVFEAQRQALGLEPLHIVFGATKHEPLAQGAGHYTYMFTREHKVMEVAGEAELGVELKQLQGVEGAIGSVVVDHPVRLSLAGLAGTPLNGVWKVVLSLEAGAKVRVEAGGVTRIVAAATPFDVAATDGRIQFTVAPVAQPGQYETPAPAAELVHVMGIVLEAAP